LTKIFEAEMPECQSRAQRLRF